MQSFFLFTLFSIWLLYNDCIIAQVSQNVELFGRLTPTPGRNSGCWGWTAEDGTEYALLGAYTGTSIINIEDKNNIHEVDFVPSSAASNWREITVIGNYAYVVTEAESAATGMQVIDLQYLPDSVHLVTNYQETFQTAHIISKNITENDAYVYVSGTKTAMGIHILDISEPVNPIEVGVYAPYYIHDCHVRGNRLYAAAINNGLIDIVDISDRTNPKLVHQLNTPFSHSCWTSEDGKYLFSTDEKDGLLGLIWDISDEMDVKLVADYTGNDSSLVHNVYIREDFAFISHNTEGLRVVDLSRPTVPVEVGYYDTYLGASGGFHGLWSAYPFFPSGKIIGGNRADGLYVFTFNDTYAGHIFGEILDSETGEAIPSAQVEIVENNTTTNSDFYGLFKFGTIASDSLGYTLLVTAPNYASVAYANVHLQEKDSLWYSIELDPNAVSVNVQLPVTNSSIHIYPNPIKEYLIFDFSQLKNRHLSVKIFNSSGQILEQLTQIKEKKKTISLAHLPIGIYCYVVEHKQGEILRQGRFIIMD